MAKLVDLASIAPYFESLDDPRHTRNRKHLLVDIVVLTVCAIICRCDGPTAIHRWAKHRQSWLAQFLAALSGILCMPFFEGTRSFQRFIRVLGW